MHVCALNCVGPFTSSWTATRQAPLSVGFPRQEYWSGLSFPPSGNLPHPRREPMSLAPAALAGRFFTNWATREALSSTIYYNENFKKMYITICKIDNQCNFDAWSRAPKASALGQPRGIGWGEEGAGFRIGETHVYLWLIHTDVWQKNQNTVK